MAAGWFILGARKRIPMLIGLLKNETAKRSMRTIFYLSIS